MRVRVKDFIPEADIVKLYEMIVGFEYPEQDGKGNPCDQEEIL